VIYIHFLILKKISTNKAIPVITPAIIRKDAAWFSIGTLIFIP
jgi:hypothetical protein